ncbi:MAG: Gfo/Idh/MocA family oxidoreductase [Oscillospiraceae bacterium]|nr:Gfo/Idh/MocA family oxidoreductase [Oscillospiraceae bacterium]MDD4368931.1 Gfo/Idh/MocA family oxidoreductase [Oscillospiraceae bacterium]
MTQKIGIIGTGGITEAHLEALTGLPEVQICAIAGRNQSRAAKLAATYLPQQLIHFYESYESMLLKERLDAVFVTLTPQLHGDMEVALAQSVPAVFIEKPMANRLEPALQARAAFKKAGTIVATGYMMRWQPGVPAAEASLREAAEVPVTLNGCWINPMPGVSWWRRQALSGGQFVEQCTHIVDTAMALAGPITEVYAMAARGFVQDVPDYDIDDALAVTVRTGSGGVGTFLTGCYQAPGQTGRVGLDLSSATRQFSFSGWSADLWLREGDQPARQIAGLGREAVFRLEDEAFLQAAATGDPSGLRSDYDSGLQTLAVTLAAVQSARENRPVRLTELL